MIAIIFILVIDLLMFFLLWRISKYYGGKKVLTPFDGKFELEEKEFIISMFIIYPVSAAIQQGFLIGIYILLNFVDWIPHAYKVIIVCILFMTLHYPNIVLMFAVLGMELLLMTMFTLTGWWFVPFMIFTHALLGTCLLKFFKSDIHRNFKVLWEFFTQK